MNSPQERPEPLRRIRRKLAWAAVILLMAGIPLLLFALVGVPHLFRGSLVRKVVAREPGGEPPDIASPHFAPAFALLTGTPLTSGNVVEVLANGDATFPRLWADLRSARRSVTVQMYYAGPGEVADTATRILAERARAGLDVYFLYDAFGAQDLPPRYLDALRAAGVRVAEFRPVRWYALDRASHRSHVRGIIVDGAVAYTGGSASMTSGAVAGGNRGSGGRRTYDSPGRRSHSSRPRSSPSGPRPRGSCSPANASSRPAIRPRQPRRVRPRPRWSTARPSRGARRPSASSRSRSRARGGGSTSRTPTSSLIRTS